jgi:3'-5' exonuclease
VIGTRRCGGREDSPSKGFDGGEVERYCREGKIKEVADYCQTDVVGTYQAWLRYELFRGTLSQNAFEASEQNLANFMALRQSRDENLLGVD